MIILILSGDGVRLFARQGALVTLSSISVMEFGQVTLLRFAVDAVALLGPFVSPDSPTTEEEIGQGVGSVGSGRQPPSFLAAPDLIVGTVAYVPPGQSGDGQVGHHNRRNDARARLTFCHLSSMTSLGQVL
jgi:hypothetical protein